LEENRFSLSFLLTHDFKQVDVPHRIEALKVLLVGILGSLILYFTLAKIFLKKEFMVILSIFKK
jgi:hypothetical protein